MRGHHFTPREHLLLGAELNTMRNRVMDLGLITQNAYGKGVGSPFFKVADRISSLKSGFESRLCSEISRSVQDIEGVPVLKVYYGWVAGPNPLRDCPPEMVLRALFAGKAEHVFDEFPNLWTEEG